GGRNDLFLVGHAMRESEDERFEEKIGGEVSGQLSWGDEESRGNKKARSLWHERARYSEKVTT
ncbi:MAG: hypothetical protein ACPGJR_09025, partial [Akkermansiaceae bacterium]